MISEALAMRVPIVASRIPGSVGLLGEEYPGYFPVRGTAGLAHLLHQAETDGTFYEVLAAQGGRLVPLMQPEHEQQTWAHLLQECRDGRVAVPRAKRSERRSE